MAHSQQSKYLFQWRIYNEMEGGAELGDLATPTFGRHNSVRIGFVLFDFFYISTIINKKNNELALKNDCHFHSSGISPTEFIDGNVYVNLDVHRVDLNKFRCRMFGR